MTEIRKIDDKTSEVIITSGEYSVSVYTFGATLHSFSHKDRDVVVGYDSYEPYITATGQPSKVIGPYANRIAGAQFTMDGKTFVLEKNDGDNSLHSGSKNFGSKYWKIDATTENSVRLSLESPEGGGFPGIPLAIRFPQARFTLCDSIGKKIKVAEAVASGLGLKNVETVNARAEDIDGKFDYIVSRAVTSLDKFMPWVKGKYRKGILYLKGGDVVEELSLIMGKYRLRSDSIHTWRISSWTDDPYFSEKLVIFIENICN